jgi:hypothetical protein
MLLMQLVSTVSLFSTGRFGQNKTIMKFMNHYFPRTETRSKGNFLQIFTTFKLNYCVRSSSMHLTSSQLSFSIGIRVKTNSSGILSF